MTVPEDAGNSRHYCVSTLPWICQSGAQWGQSPSQHADYIVLLKTLLRSSGVKVKEENFQKLFQAIHKHCHWLDPERGTLCIDEWKEVIQELFQAIHKHCHWLDLEKGTTHLNEWKEVMCCLHRAYQSGEPIPISVWSVCNLIYTTLTPL